MWPLAVYLTFLNFSFLICKMWTIITPIFWGSDNQITKCIHKTWPSVWYRVCAQQMLATNMSIFWKSQNLSGKSYRTRPRKDKPLSQNGSNMIEINEEIPLKQQKWPRESNNLNSNQSTGHRKKPSHSHSTRFHVPLRNIHIGHVCCF